MRKRILSGLLVLCMVVLSACTVKISQPKGAEKVNKELTTKTILIFGEDLPEQERQVLREYFKNEKVEEHEITADDYEQYFGVRPRKGSLLSSVAVNYAKGKGIGAKILTPDKITEVKEHQYINSAITAGLEDVAIRVVSTRKVTGESALGGVFKSYKLLGLEVNADKLKNAQEELSTLGEISVSLNEEDLKKLSDVIVKTKERLSKAKAEDKEANVGTILDEELTKQKVELKDSDKAKLTKNLDGFNSLITKEDAKVFLDRASKIGKSLIDGGSEVFNNLKDSGFFSKIWEGIKSIFR